MSDDNDTGAPAAPRTQWQKKDPIVVQGTDGIVYHLDSPEEEQMLHWLEEAKGAGYVGAYARGTTMKLFDPIVRECGYMHVPKRGEPELRSVERTFLKGRTYTPDFTMTLLPRFKDDFLKGDSSKTLSRMLMLPMADWDKETRTITIDVKGAYVQQDRREEFNLKRHAVYGICKILVREIDPAKLFALTWVPRASAFQKIRGGRCATFASCRLLGESREGSTGAGLSTLAGVDLG